MNKASLKRFFLIGVIASLVISAATGIVILLKGNLDDTDWRVLSTTLVVGIFSITSLSNLRNLDSPKRPLHLFAVSSIGISVAGFLLYTVLIWGSELFFSDDQYWKVALTLLILAISSAHASLLLPLYQNDRINKQIIPVTFLFISLVAGMLIFLAWNEFYLEGDFFYRILGVFAILDVLGTIVCAITARFTHKPPTVEAPPSNSSSST